LQAEDLEGLKTVLHSHSSVEKIVEEDGKLLVYTKTPLEASELNKYLSINNIYLSHLVKRKNSLESQFLELTKNK
jgi:ABC-2 type transport system ATP-binding protein